MNATPVPNTLASARHAMPTTPHPLQCLDSVAAVRPCHRRQQICRQGQVANTWYCVLAGAALRCVNKSDGRRQVVDLLLPGDFFGLTNGNEYDYTVESAAPSTVIAAYPRKQIESQADSDPQLARELRQITFDRLSRLQEQLMILGRITAPEKVGAFLLTMAARQANGHSDLVTLPISRYDIADYLAVSVETVSRALSELKKRGLIRISGTRLIQIIDREAPEDGEHDDVLERPPSGRQTSAQSRSAKLARTESRTAWANCCTPKRSIIRAR